MSIVLLSCALAAESFDLSMEMKGEIFGDFDGLAVVCLWEALELD
jgi:hypothetical protein